MNKKFLLVLLVLVVGAHSAHTMCSVLGDMIKIVRPRWSVTGRTEYKRSDSKIYVVAVDYSGNPVTNGHFEKMKVIADDLVATMPEMRKVMEELPENSERHLKMKKMKKILKGFEATRAKLEKDLQVLGQFQVDGLGTYFVSKDGGLIELREEPLVVSDDRSTVHFQRGSPFFNKTELDSGDVKKDMVQGLKTECLQPFYRRMLGDRVMKVWFISFWTGTTIAVLIAAEKLYEKFIRPHMEKTTKRLVDELGEDIAAADTE